MKDMLLKFLKPYGATGHEEPIAQVIRETVQPLVDSVETDALGNVICIKKGRAGAKRIMVSAHMDQAADHDSSQRDNGDLGGIRADIDNHDALGALNIHAQSHGIRHGFFHHIHLFGFKIAV